MHMFSVVAKGTAKGRMHSKKATFLGMGLENDLNEANTLSPLSVKNLNGI